MKQGLSTSKARMEHQEGISELAETLLEFWIPSGAIAIKSVLGWNYFSTAKKLLIIAEVTNKIARRQGTNSAMITRWFDDLYSVL